MNAILPFAFLLKNQFSAAAIKDQQIDTKISKHEALSIKRQRDKSKEN